MACSPDGNIVAGILKGNTLVPYMIERKKWYTRETIIDAEYADNQELLANARVQAESWLHSLEQAAGGSGIYVNANEIGFMCF